MNKSGVVKTAGGLIVLGLIVIVLSVAFFSNGQADEVTVTESVTTTTTATEIPAEPVLAETEAEAEAAMTAGSETVVIESSTTITTMSDTDIDVDALMQDRVLGNPDAPVTVVEYASMTCSHCANFHNDHLPAIKKELIETGEVKFIFREFPLDGVALRASMMARCAPADKFFGLLEVLFANQRRWVGADDPIDAMTKMGKLAGISDARMEACLSNKELETALLEGRQNATKTYELNSTPSFVFNDGAHVQSGVTDVEGFRKIISGL